MYQGSTRSSREWRGGRVLLVGIGALGCPAALVLAGTSYLRLTIIDPDRVELSNLQRQPLFDDGAVGDLKAEVAVARLRAHGAHADAIVGRLEECNAEELIREHDFVIDACDDPATKVLINRVAVRVGRPFSYGGVTRTSGVSMLVIPDAGPCLECVFPDAPRATNGAAAAAEGRGCQDLGVLAPVAGVIGSLQALHVLAMLGGAPRMRSGHLISYELHGRRWRVIEARRNPRCTACGAEVDSERRIVPCRS